MPKYLISSNPDAPCMVYLPTTLGDFVRANVGTVNILAPWSIWAIHIMVSFNGIQPMSSGGPVMLWGVELPGSTGHEKNPTHLDTVVLAPKNGSHLNQSLLYGWL